METSGGGVTLSGGEPLAQPGFAAALLEACRAEGLHTAVDTCGCASPDALERLLPLADLWLYDLKHLDPEAHREATGLSNERVLQNLCRLNAAGAPVMLRVPLIPAFNDTPENLSALEALAPTLSCVRELRLLPYHRFQEDKYRRLGLTYPGSDIATPDDAQVEAIRVRLAASTGWTVAVGG
jgi:pyruvate formate lyase activating enzyme